MDQVICAKSLKNFFLIIFWNTEAAYIHTTEKNTIFYICYHIKTNIVNEKKYMKIWLQNNLYKIAFTE